MTVIAWDGVTLAADKQSTNTGFAHKATKIYRVDTGIVGFTGSASHAMALIQWFKNGCWPAEWPKPGDPNNCSNALFITQGGEIRAYDGAANGQYEIHEDKFVAFGCGRDYALAAMYLGRTAREAVEVACALDVFCGQGVDTLTLDDLHK